LEAFERHDTKGERGCYLKAMGWVSGVWEDLVVTGDLEGKMGYLPCDSGETMFISASCPQEICNASSVIQMGATGAAKPWKAT